MALSLCRWNSWFNPQQSGHCYPLLGALQSRQLSKRDDYVRIFCFGITRLIILIGQFSLKQNLPSKLVLLLANPVVQRS